MVDLNDADPKHDSASVSPQIKCSKRLSEALTIVTTQCMLSGILRAYFCC